MNLVYDSKAQQRFYQATGRLERTEQYLVVRTGKSETELTNNKRRHSMYCNAEANY